MLQLSLLQPSIKKVFYSLLFSLFVTTIYGALYGNNLIAGSAFIAFMLTILLFVDRKEAVNRQTTNGDMIVTGIALVVLLPLCTSFLAACGLGSLILGSGTEETFTGVVFLLFVTAIIFYLIRITSRLFERKNWKLSLEE